jgi:aminodeoxyfutalosine synthase
VAEAADHDGRGGAEGGGNLAQDCAADIMTLTLSAFPDLETRVAAGEALSAADAARVLGSSDLLSVGLLGEMARKARHGDRVTYGRVCEVAAAGGDVDRGEAAEVRIVAVADSAAAAAALVRSVAPRVDGATLTGFSAADLLALAGGDLQTLAETARTLSEAGLEAVASAPLDRLGDAAAAALRALRDGGLGVWRLTVDRAPREDRLALIERAAAVQQEIGGLHAFAPLPRLDPPEAPSTGYDDVRTVAVARLVCRDIPSVQVDWQLYGPKLAQVAIAYGADDLDNVPGVDMLQLGPRRSPREDIERQIRAAFAAPAERDGRFGLRS